MFNYTDLGLVFLENFITQEEENFILSSLAIPDKIKQSLKDSDKLSRNSVSRYGPKAPYHNGIVSKEIPPYLNFVAEKILLAKFTETMPQSVSINEYLEGQGMNSHIDNQNAGPIITILSIKSLATMKFKKNKEFFSLDLPPRSLIQMKNEIRNKWEHEILPVKETRYSIVFRCY